MQGRQLQLPPHAADQHPHSQYQHHGIAGPEMTPQQEGQQQGAKQQGILRGNLEQIQPESEQHAGEHGGGQWRRDMPHQTVEPAADTTQGDQQGRDHKGADGFRQSEVAQRSDQQCRARGGPGGQYGHAVIEREADAAHPHADPQRPEPGGDLGSISTRRRGGLDDQDDGAGVADHHGDKACDQMGEGEGHGDFLLAL